MGYLVPPAPQEDGSDLPILEKRMRRTRMAVSTLFALTGIAFGFLVVLAVLL